MYSIVFGEVAMSKFLRKFSEEEEKRIVKGSFFKNLMVYLGSAGLVEFHYLLGLPNKISMENHPTGIILLIAIPVWGLLTSGGITLKRRRGDRIGEPIFFEWFVVILGGMFISGSILYEIFKENIFQFEKSIVPFLLLVSLYCFLLTGYWQTLAKRHTKK